MSSCDRHRYELYLERRKKVSKLYCLDHEGFTEGWTCTKCKSNKKYNMEDEFPQFFI